MQAGRGRIIGLWILVAVVAAACSGDSPAAPSDSVGGIPTETRITVDAATDASSLEPDGPRLVELIDLEELIEMREAGVERTFEPEYSAPVGLRSCTLVTPFTYRFDLTFDEADTPAEGWLSLGFSYDDTGFGVLAHIAAPQPGELVVDVRLPPDTRRAWRCSVGFFERRIEEASVDLALSDEPLVWEATPGTAQALGIGAVLSDLDDDRNAWATWYHADGTTSADPIAVIPPNVLDDPTITVHSSVGDDGCRDFAIRLERVGLEHESGCRPDRFADRIPPPDAETVRLAGFDAQMWPEDDRTWQARVVDEGISIWARSREELIAVIDVVTLVPSEQITPLPVTPYVGATMDEAIANGLAEDDYALRTVIVRDGRPLVIATGPTVKTGLTDPHAQIRFYDVVQREDDWIVEYAGGGGWDQCRNAGGSAGSMLVVAGRPDWVVQVDAGTGWEDVPTVDGVALLDPTAYDPDRISIGVADASGTPINCETYRAEEAETTDGTWVPGEETTDVTTTP